MLKSLSARNRTALDIVNVVAGLGLALSPWYIGFAADTYAAWNAWIVGAVIALIAIVALVTFHQAEEWGQRRSRHLGGGRALGARPRPKYPAAASRRSSEQVPSSRSMFVVSTRALRSIGTGLRS